jgi:hypothetical protein
LGYKSRASHLLPAGFLPGAFFGPEDGGDISCKPSIDFQRTLRRHIPKHKLFLPNMQDLYLIFTNIIRVRYGT